MQNSTTILGIIEMRLMGISYDDCCKRYGVGHSTVNLIMSRYQAKGIPLAHEMARQTNAPKYLLARKAPKLYMTGVFEVVVNSITTEGEQHLYLDTAEAEQIKGKKVIIVDDVISTGESLKAVEKLIEMAEVDYAGALAVLAEGEAADRKDIIYLEKLPLFDAEGNVL